MRKSGKLIGALMAVILVITSFSSMVAAAPGIVTEGDYESAYHYVLDINGKLTLTCHNMYFSLEGIAETYRDQIKTIVCELPQDINFLEISGLNCPAESITLTGCENDHINYIYIENLPSLKSINLPEDATVETIDLCSLAISSLDFMKLAEVEFLHITDCPNLKDIHIPSPIELATFNCCPNLEKLTANDTLKGIRFFEVPSTVELHLPSYMIELVWYGYDGKTLNIPNYDKVCLNSPDLETVTFDEGRTKIGGGMFMNCTALKEIDIPETVTKIQYSAFMGCESLKEVSIPANVKTITVDAFKGCSSLTDVYFGGTEKQWANIEVPAHDPEEDHNVYSIADVFGDNVTIHFMIEPGWNKEGDKWFYFDEDGEAVVSDWVKDGGRWYYLDENGVMVTGWKKIEGKWYYFDTTSGAMKTGWVQDGGSWYYLKSNGEMATGWIQDGGKWYYLKSNGVMYTGWLKDGGSWYYLKSNGEMATGWIQDGGKWYYLRSNGTMYTGWLKDGGKWYYLYPSTGAMACSTSVEIDGKVYNFNASGVCTNP